MSTLMLKLIVNRKISGNTNYFSSKFITTSYKTNANIRENDAYYFVSSSGHPTGGFKFEIIQFLHEQTKYASSDFPVE